MSYLIMGLFFVSNRACWYRISKVLNIFAVELGNGQELPPWNKLEKMEKHSVHKLHKE